MPGDTQGGAVEPPSRALWRSLGAQRADEGRDGARWLLSDLVHTYALAIDDGDVDTVVDMFAPDGEFVREGRAVRGSVELRDFFERMSRSYLSTLHVPQAHVIADLEDDDADGIATGQAELVLPDGTLLLAAYRYRDRYRRRRGVWRFARRELGFQYVVPASEFPTVMGAALRIRRPGVDPERAAYPESITTWRERHSNG